MAKDYLSIASEIKELEDLLAAIPEGNVIERLSLKSRLESARSALTDAPFTCKYCGRPSWIDPSDQTQPPDYCHEADHRV